MTQLKTALTRLVLIPSDGGRFEISVNGKQVYSKLATGRFPEFAEIQKFLK